MPPLVRLHKTHVGGRTRCQHCDILVPDIHMMIAGQTMCVPCASKHITKQWVTAQGRYEAQSKVLLQAFALLKRQRVAGSVKPVQGES